MTVVGFFEKSVNVYLSTRGNIPETFVYHIQLILNAWDMIRYLNFLLRMQGFEADAISALEKRKT